MERRDPAAHSSFVNMEGRGEMMKAPIKLQDLRRKIYAKAKAESSWRFWGLYVHICKVSTLEEAYRLAKKNNGSPGIDGVTFDAIEAAGVSAFLSELSGELRERTYRPSRVRKVEIPKGEGKVRVLSIPTIRDRVVQGAVKLILEPIFEADFQPGSFAYRPQRNAQDALARVSTAITRRLTYVIDLDLKAYFDTVRHHVVLKKVALRVDDDEVMCLLKLILRATGKRGVPQGGVISPLLSNIYLNEVDKMLERAREVTMTGQWQALEYARFADDLVILVDGHPNRQWLRTAVEKRLREEFAVLQVEVNEEKTRVVDLTRGESFGFLGFDFRRVRTPRGRWMPLRVPQPKKLVAMRQKLKEIFRRSVSQPLERVVSKINPILRGWVQYFRTGHSSRAFSRLRDWVEKKMRRLLMKARQRRGFGWKRWGRRWLYDSLGLFDEYRVKRYTPALTASPAGYVS